MEDAAELVVKTEKRFPDAVRLARVVSIASRIEPELLREARLQLLAPAVDVGAEADLWFSPLVQSTTPVALTLLPAVADLLRRQLAESPVALRRSWELLDQVHQDAPAAIRLEERVTWETLSRAAGSLQRVENELMSAVSAINEQNRLGLARWALRAVPRLPQEARETKAATTLVLTAAARLNAWHLLEKQIDSNTLASGFMNELQVVLPADFPKVPVGLRLLENVTTATANSSGRRQSYAIEFSAPPSAGVNEVIDVPGTAPLMIEVSWGDGATPDRKNVSLYQGRTETVAVGGSGTVTIRTAAGDVYTLSEDKERYVSASADAPAPALARIPGAPSIGYVRRYDKSKVDMVEKLTRELSPDVKRVVQVVGPAGIGKTTLAAEFARQLLDTYEQRVVWLSAAGRSDFSLNSLLDGIATQLSRSDIRTLDPKSKTKEVKSLLHDDIALVVVDDFEIIGTKEQTRCFDFLKRYGCATVIVSRKIITRSPGKDVIPLGAMSRDEAAEFLKRIINEGQQSDTLESPNLTEQVIAVCEGNPLAMQLLLAQIESPQDAIYALKQMTRVSGDPLTGVFDLSFTSPQLSEEARRVLLALALFVPSASKTALASIALLDGNLERLNQAAAQLTRLKLAWELGDGNRLGVDGFIRDVLQQRLSGASILNELRQRFVAYFLQFAEHNSEPDTRDYNLLEAELENLLDAMDMAEGLRSWEELTRLCLALVDFFDVRGYWDEALRRNAQAQGAARKSGQKDQLPALYLASGYIYLKRREFAKAQAAFQRVLTHYAGKPVNIEVAIATRRLGSIALQKENLKLAESFYSEALAISRQLGFQTGVADNIHNLAIVKQEQGSLNEARRLYHESLELSGSLNDDRSQAISLHQLGVIAMDIADYTEAEQYFRRSLDIKSKLQDRSGMADTLHQLGLLYQEQGKNKDAEAALRDALGIFSQLGSPSVREVQEDLNSLLGVSTPAAPPVAVSTRRPSKAASKKRRSMKRSTKTAGAGRKKTMGLAGSGRARPPRKLRRSSAKSYR
jgi:tetratricopeptide (TPR) repeat protein